mgnify:FL=1
MAKKKTPGGTAGKGGVNPAPTRDNQTVRIAAEQLTMVPIDDLIPYANNAKKHGVKQINQIRASLREFGFVTPVLIDFDNNIIAGHGRVEAARAEGMSEVPCVLVTNLTEAQRKAYILADNRLSETAVWDTELLKIELEGLEALNFDTGIAGFDAEAMEELGVEIGSSHTQAEAYEDDFDEDPPEETSVREGDIYQLGRHRLMCGDSTDKKVLELLMDGNKANLTFTDPPYGINAVKANKVGGSGPVHFGKVGGKNIVPASTYMAIKGDDTTDTAKLNYEIIKDISENQIIFGGNYFTDFLPPKSCWCIWDKENSGNFADVEMAWTSFDKGAKLYHWLWNGLCRKGSRKLEGKSRVHPTQKPVGLIAEILKDFTKENDIILDCFCGSGSTLIACEQINRKCYAIEYEAHYVDVIIARWEAMTGEKAVLLNDRARS